MHSSYKLLQWNTWYEEKPENVLALLKEIDPDIACLQELTQNYGKHDYCDVPKLVAEKLGWNIHFHMAQYWPTKKGKEIQGNAIVSKHPLKNPTHHYIQDLKHDNFDDYSNEGRVCVGASINLEGKMVEIATTHMSYTHMFEETEQKIEEENNLLRYISNKKSGFILAGDFNVTENSQLVKKLEGKFQNAAPDYSYKTWTTKPFDYKGFKETELNWRLDHVFCTKDIQVKSSQVIQTEFSDHLPILVEFSI